MESITTAKIKAELQSLQNQQKAEILKRFFKTGPGEYAEGDRFLGVTVPLQRKVVKKYPNLSVDELVSLLRSEIHEHRMVALLMMVARAKKADKQTRQALFEVYLSNTRYINNWDLVDLSAEYIVGAYVDENSQTILKKLARSEDLWERRIAILATFHFIKRGNPQPTLEIAEMLLRDKHDLIHKAVGWMLREVGKRCSQPCEEEFLQKHLTVMPRTMLRYAIERFEESKRKRYLSR